MNIRRTHSLLSGLLLLCSILLLCACGGGGTPDGNGLTNPARYPQYFPSRNIMPYPNNLLFQGSEDGTLNAPFEAGTPVEDMYIPLNSLDGFSNIAPFTASFNTAVDPATLIGGDTVRVYEVTLAGVGGAVTGITRELDPSEYWVGVDNSEPPMLVITPTKALKPKTSYMAILTSGIKDAQGQTFEASTVYELSKRAEPLVDGNGRSRLEALSDAEAQELEAVRQLNTAAESAVTTFDTELARASIILSWTFTTQSLNDSLMAVRDAVEAAPPPLTVLEPYAGEDNRPFPQCDIYVGTIRLPYYLAVPTEADPYAPLTGYWHGPNGSYLTAGNPMPEKTLDHDIPLVVTVPRAAKPEGGWPVVIFQHGNTSNRAALISIADEIAAAGFVAVAIDLPMHGITGLETDGSQNLRQPGRERHFDIDQLTNGTPVPEPDGKTDPSGSYFIKLNQVLTTRDNIRQGVADLLGLRRSLVNLDYDNDDVPDLDTTHVRFIGHSAGATVGSVYLGVDDKISAATLGMPGGALAKQLDGSASSGPSIAEGMATNGIIKGTPNYERFLAAVQMVLDPADPLNYAVPAANRPLHLIEVIGSETSLPDQIVPNNVLNVPGTVPSPTGGTDPMWQVMGLSIASTSLSGSDPLRIVVRFTAGHHSSLISQLDAEGNVDPLSKRAMEEMQGQIISFMVSNGRSLTVADPELLSSD